jgi:hypothetical protein
MFAIGYGIPPNGPLRAIRRAASPLAGQIAAYLGATSRNAAVSSTTPAERKRLKSRVNR